MPPSSVAAIYSEEAAAIFDVSCTPVEATIYLWTGDWAFPGDWWVAILASSFLHMAGDDLKLVTILLGIAVANFLQMAIIFHPMLPWYITGGAISCYSRLT